ncbi:putative nitrate transporter protein [Botrytis fragariae]|uniref:Nitrate/nitrite transporter n=1 Tax=Botrytis fragariae TaxID=1964551 RepID=A0A8H6EN61_9HELO|nr:putative nitrate transporter protein [Botrytis fragariae]KAF5878402.1 putative nitrate transporter protein [Botrytis fragariae]
MFKIQTLWQAPEINPVNGKARSIPVLNPFNKYGRVFFFSWWGFLIAFWSWYAFPPLLSLTIKKDLHLTQNEIANSNIIALVATLLVRLVAGPCCDHFGPKVTFAGCLLLGAIPTALAGTVTSATGLMVLRFFIGILGGSFVPCQVWSTGFFDKNIVGTANSLTGGWGNSGGGITYFVMPAIVDSLILNQGLTAHVAWRVSFIVPFILITTTAISMLILCPDTPTGKWSDRHLVVQQNLRAHGIHSPSDKIVSVPGSITDRKPGNIHSPTDPVSSSNSIFGNEKRLEEEAQIASAKHSTAEPYNNEATLPPQEMLTIARGEVIQKPSFKEALNVILTPQTLLVASCYFCSFGAELAINSILGSYYLKNFPKLGEAGTGRWAAMFGLLNIVFRPLGGILSDLLYRKTGNVWAKKIWLHTLAIFTGAFLIAIGLTDSHNHSTMFGLVAGMGLFLEAGNGANFSLVPHIHPFANGIISGVVGACGNLGGIVFAIIFRYEGKDYAKCFWIIGVFTIAVNVAVSWVKPIPKGQVGGR